MFTRGVVDMQFNVHYCQTAQVSNSAVLKIKY